MFEIEPDNTQPVKSDDIMGELYASVSYNYADIQRTGSDELKRAVEIILNGYQPGGERIAK